MIAWSNTLIRLEWHIQWQVKKSIFVRFFDHDFDSGNTSARAHTHKHTRARTHTISASYLAQFTHIGAKVTSSVWLRRHLARRRTYFVCAFGSDDLQATFGPEMSEILFIYTRIFESNDSFVNKDNHNKVITEYHKLKIHIFLYNMYKNFKL